MPHDLTGLDVLNLTAFLFCIVFCAYVIGILVPYLRAPRAGHGDPGRYDWHAVVPCLNEAAVVGTTVRRLLAAFPAMTVWCVDDGSTDGTAAILAGLARESDRVRVVTRRPPFARQGKGAALNSAWYAIAADLPRRADRSAAIVVVVDADSELDPDCLRVLAGPGYFGDPGVAAGQIEVRMNRAHLRVSAPGLLQRLLVRLQDLEFRGPIAAMQQLRRQTGSVALGGNGQFSRLSALDAVAAAHGTPWHGALLEDFELGLHVLLTGGRTEYAQETWVEQEALVRLRPLLRQRTRWAQGSMQCMRYLPAILRSRYIRNSAALELVYFLFLPWVQLLATLVYLGATVVLGWYVETTPGRFPGWWHDGGWSVIPLVVAFGITPFALWGPVYRMRSRAHIGWGQAVGLGLAHWLYSYAQCVATWLAFLRLVRAKSDWQKTRRAGDRVLVLRHTVRVPTRTLIRRPGTTTVTILQHTEVPRG
jgi:1,2-diacylglycerol 3-beta-glucosyltransferase